jgi:hypothetical protein
MIVLILCLVLPVVAQAGADNLDNLWDLFIERLESTRVAGLHRLEIEAGRALVAPALPEGRAGELDVIRRSRSDGGIVYRPVSRLRAGDAARLASGEAVPGLTTGDLLRFVGSRPRLVVRLAAAGLTGDIPAQLEGSLAARIEGTGLYRTDKPPDTWAGTLFFHEETDDLKAALRKQGADALLNVVVHRSGERLQLLCQVISVNGGDDEIFGVEGSLTPELALLFSEAGTRHESPSAQPVISVAVPSDVLAVAAAQLDEAEGDEIAVLRPRELLIYSVSGEAVELLKKISLAELPAAAYATRRPVGMLSAVDIDGNGRQELLIGSNLWAGGAIVWLDGFQVSFTFLDLQPLQPASLNGHPAFLAGRYKPGEDTFEETVFIVDQSLVAREAGELSDLRTILRLDARGRQCAVVDSFGEMRVWDRAGENSELSPSGISSAAVLGRAEPGLGDGWLLQAEESVGGSLIKPVKPPSGETLRIGVLSTLDIAALTAYNPPGSPPAALIVCGLDAYGGMKMAIYDWPW